MKKLVFVMLILVKTYSHATSSKSNSSLDTKLNLPAKSLKEGYLLNKAVAIVNGKAITSFELNKELTRLKTMRSAADFNIDPLKLKKQALKNLIARSILIQLARQNNISISNSQLDAAIRDIAAKSQISLETLKLNTEFSGIPFDEYKQRVKEQLMVRQLQQQVISQQVYVSPQEIQNYIKKHKEQFDKQMNPSKLYTLKNLVVTLPKSKQERNKKIDKFKKLTIAVNSGYMDFSTMAKQFSEAPNASLAGLLDQKIEFDLVPEVYKRHLKQLKEHQASQPFIVDQTLQMIYIEKLDYKAAILPKQITKYYVYAIKINLGNSMTTEDAKNTLNQARLAIKNNHDFTKIAKKYNQDYSHADGNFKWVSKLDNQSFIPPQAFVELEKLSKDEISKPFQADPKTWMIIKYTKTKKYDATKEIQEQKALQEIFTQKAEEIYKTWLISMKNNSYIKILEDDLKTVDS